MAKGGGRRGGGGGGEGRGGAARLPQTREVLVSKKLSWLLRHGAESQGLKLGKGGYISLAEVLSNQQVRSMKPAPTVSEIKSMVAANDKKRYSLVHVSAFNASSDSGSASSASYPDAATDASLDADTDPHNYLIRANQGHSLKVDAAELLTPITLDAGNLPAVVVHGTKRELWPRIAASGGLRPMSRMHVHFATGVPESLAPAAAVVAAGEVVGDEAVAALPERESAPLVLSGMRGTSTLLIFVNLRLALERGLRFWFSENGVVLSEGDERRLVGLELFEKVVDVDGSVLARDGVALSDAGGAVAGSKGKQKSES